MDFFRNIIILMENHNNSWHPDLSAKIGSIERQRIDRPGNQTRCVRLEHVELRAFDREHVELRPFKQQAPSPGSRSTTAPSPPPSPTLLNNGRLTGPFISPPHRADCAHIFVEGAQDHIVVAVAIARESHHGRERRGGDGG